MNSAIKKTTAILLIGILPFTSYLGIKSWKQAYGMSTVAISDDTILSIEAKSNAKKIIAQLNNLNIITSSLQLKLYLYLINATTNIKAGDYLVTSHMTYKELINNMILGKQISYKIRLEEGKSVDDAIKELSSHHKLSNSTDINTFLTTLLIKPSGYPQDDNIAEGLLFPDTYEFFNGATIESIIHIANQKLIKVLMEEWNTRDKKIPYKTPYEALIVASMIEKESGLEAEKCKISGVFVRRLQKKMRLQADPTVIYGIKDEYNGKLTKKMLIKETPYNTYKIPRLPPAPISLVSRSSIYAAMHPDTSNCLYFVSKGDGSHHFSDNLAEHQKAIKKYLKKAK
jgi:UPF0755 protein